MRPGFASPVDRRRIGKCARLKYWHRDCRCLPGLHRPGIPIRPGRSIVGAGSTPLVSFDRVWAVGGPNRAANPPDALRAGHAPAIGHTAGADEVYSDAPTPWCGRGGGAAVRLARADGGRNKRGHCGGVASSTTSVPTALEGPRKLSLWTTLISASSIFGGSQMSRPRGSRKPRRE
jgi:hypothetical protein